VASGVGAESITRHYLTAYRSEERIDVSSWVAWMKAALQEGESALINPFDPTEKEYHKLMQWMPLADLDELLFGQSHVDSATCMAWWLCHTEWQTHRPLRPDGLWRRALRKAYLQADFKALNVKPERVLAILEKEPWASKESLEYLQTRRTNLWPKTSKWKAWKQKGLDWVRQRKLDKERKAMNRQLDEVLKRGATFEPRTTAAPFHQPH
jgi:hypothetical protein